MADRFLELIREVHRRSLWQVLGVYVASSWGVLQVIEFLIETAGLPDWVQPFALVLLLIGLPIVLATAFVQEGTPGGSRSGDSRAATRDRASPEAPEEADPDAASRLAHAASDGGAGAEAAAADPARGSRRQRLFTWRNALLGGAAAGLVLLLAIGGFYAMRNLGIGPAATLSAQGVLDARDEILLADFDSQGDDASLAPVVTDALRVDLGNSEFLRLTEANRVRSVLGRMGRPDADLTEEVALEAATREGIKAVLAGEVSRLGPGHVLTARILEPSTGNTLASFRSVARTEADLIDAIDELSASIRAKVGESLRSVARSEPLSAVTTGSLEALRLYSQAMSEAQVGSDLGAIPLLERAIEEDPEFAMAYRKLGVSLANTGGSPQAIREAATRAYELRDRLTDRERHLAEAYYYRNVTLDRNREIDAYEAVLAIDPDDGTALNNLGIAYLEAGRFEDSERTLRRAMRTTDLTTPYTNLVRLLWVTRREDEIPALLDTMSARGMANLGTVFMEAGIRQLSRRWTEGHESALALASSPQVPIQFRSFLSAFVANSDIGLGRLQEARRHWAQGMEDAARTDAPARWRLSLTGLRAVNEVLAAEDTALAVSLIEDAFADLTAETLRAHPAEVLWAAGLLAGTGRTQRAEAIATAAGALSDAPETEELRLSRDAFTFWMAFGRGDFDEAVELQRAIRAQTPGCDQARCVGAIQLALALDAAGRVDEAIEAYQWHVGGSVLDDVAIDAAALGTALERLTLLYAAQGRAAEARRTFARFADLWGDAEEPLANRVRRVEREIASLIEPARN